MRVLIAPDKFKGTLSAKEAADAIANGIRAINPSAQLDLLPLADGGEGTVAALAGMMELVETDCRDALGNPTRGVYAWDAEQRLAVIEACAACGIQQISPEKRNPMQTTTFGCGELIADALRRGAKMIAVGLGGSGTNDAGAGLAAGLGWGFLDVTDAVVDPIPENFPRIASIMPGPALHSVEVVALCDVANPLLGPRGCSRVYGPQKGATPEQVERLELALTRFADLCGATLGYDHREAPGAGAAGGLGYGLITFCGARITPGFDWIAERLGLEQRLGEAHWVVTGEGSLDAQSLEGKGPVGLAKLARSHGRKCVAFAGRVEACAAAAFDRAIAITPEGMPMETARKCAGELLQAAAGQWANSVIGVEQ